MVPRKGAEAPQNYTQPAVINRRVGTFDVEGGAKMASRKIQALNDIDFDTRVLEANGPVLVDFTAAWCGPCKLQSAILDQLVETECGVAIAAVDVDESPELAARYGIRGMPTLVLFEGGREKARRVGVTKEAGIRALLHG
jgi:thioredoxin 1